MHSQLSDKKIVCKDFIEALEKCHSNNWARLLGFCNLQKDELNLCLREERLKRTTANRELSQERKHKAEEARKKFYSDE
ncbi:COX assembly mitochondrial protein [Mycena indigotica]|uniref:COX assembly mitochondrial protein n=1 Tax=Mycena indigotica TaxID=2126181 RepID=A0A8H6SC32_9AGAR|nr:COX assembly mitochondrial protein [Mycena indigotica]KAF7295105.1 COX assembly mitochondrial protein [Mycena indigotica]